MRITIPTVSRWVLCVAVVRRSTAAVIFGPVVFRSKLLRWKTTFVAVMMHFAAASSHLMQMGVCCSSIVSSIAVVAPGMLDEGTLGLSYVDLDNGWLKRRHTPLLDGQPAPSCPVP